MIRTEQLELYKSRADKRAKRDFMQFCQILDDLFGEHD